ncbi:hypothetical protein E2C01_084775 [Portunus trituberculatus]|uniref:Uncharacterized protein n=1 Tax=Portunus trituberculatus TaxID=210409 RepID=A0A5B7J4X3_PORTR|nr:hypothetical protein [Portunus trituberculatus]
MIGGLGQVRLPVGLVVPWWVVIDGMAVVVLWLAWVDVVLTLNAAVPFDPPCRHCKPYMKTYKRKVWPALFLLDTATGIQVEVKMSAMDSKLRWKWVGVGVMAGGRVLCVVDMLGVVGGMSDGCGEGRLSARWACCING